MCIISEKEIGLLFADFAYDEEKYGVIGIYYEDGYPLYCANKKWRICWDMMIRMT